MFTEVPIRRGQYAPNKLVSPRAEAMRWAIEYHDGAGNVTGGLTCPDAVEIRFAKPGGTTSFQISVRGELDGGEGPEWTVIMPAGRLGILHLPEGFTAEQSMMGAVYRLAAPRHIRLLLEQKLHLPALNLPVQFL